MAINGAEELAQKLGVKSTYREDTGRDDETFGSEHQVDLDKDTHGDLSIEYKPKKHVLDEASIEEIPDHFDLGSPQKTVEPEDFVAELYWALIHLLYPSSAYLDEPWERLPLVVEYRYQRTDLESPDASEFFVSKGSYG
jgi:hypothetical protein